MLWAGHYTEIKPPERARVGKPEELIVELIRLAWVLISPDQKNILANMMFPKTCVHDYKNLLSIDLLGVKEEHVR